jgi:hypothetical protein
MEMSIKLHAPAALPPRKELPVPIVLIGWGGRSLFGGCGEEKKLLPCPESNPDYSVI